MFYAAHNIYANLINGNRGFLNTWAVSRFATRAERDAFVDRYSNKDAKAVSSKEAVDIWQGTYLCVGEDVPAGGLFGVSRFGDTHFWNENAGALSGISSTSTARINQDFAKKAA